MINPNTSPCYNCGDRVLKCHAWCKAYKEYQRIRTDYNEKEKKFEEQIRDQQASFKDIDFKDRLKVK